MTSEDLVQLVRRRFDLTAERLSLHGPSVKETPFEVSIAYFDTEIGLRVTVDVREFGIYVMVFRRAPAFRTVFSVLGGFNFSYRVFGKRLVPVGYKNRQGQVHTMYLTEVLERVGRLSESDDEELRRLASDENNGEVIADREATLVEMNWGVIRARTAELFG